MNGINNISPQEHRGHPGSKSGTGYGGRLGVHAEKSSAAVLEASFCAHPQKTFPCVFSSTSSRTGSDAHNRKNESLILTIKEVMKKKKTGTGREKG